MTVMKNILLSIMILVASGIAHAQDNVVSIIWNETTGVPSIATSSTAVTTSISGGNITLTNSNTTDEYTYILKGVSNDGSFTLNSDFKNTIVLDGLNLHSSKGEAINLKCGKRTALVLSDNTENIISDAETNLGQKAVIYSKGHIEVEGAGALNLTANASHGISTKEYCQFKESTGKIDILCKADGAKGVKSKTDIIIDGGRFNIQAVGNAIIEEEAGVRDTSTAACLKSDSSIVITSGRLNLLTSGSGGKCINCDGTLIVGKDSGVRDTTSLAINARSLGVIFGEESTDGTDTQSKPKAIKIDGTVTINNGLLDLYTSEEGGEGLESKTNIVMNNGFIRAYCKDDCINSSGSIIFNDGFVYCISDGNDAIDTNIKGVDEPAITVNGATVIGISAGGKREQGIDTNRSPVYVNGGFFLSVGGEQGGVEPKMRGDMAAVYLRKAQLDKGKYYTFCCNDKPLYTLLMEFQPTGDYVTWSANGLTRDSECRIAESDAAPYSYSSEENGIFWVNPNNCDYQKSFDWTQTANFTKVDAVENLRPTSISEICSDTENASAEIYDIQGRRLQSVPANGIYIVGKRKLK